MARPRLLAGALATGLLLTGCGSAGSSIVDAASSAAASAVAGVQCQAITAAQSKLGDLQNADPAVLESVRDAVDQVSAGLSALGDRVPAQVKQEFSDAAGKLDQAVTDAKDDRAAAQAALTEAGQKMTSSLQSLSTSAGC
jgi:hypothetical protein